MDREPRSKRPRQETKTEGAEEISNKKIKRSSHVRTCHVCGMQIAHHNLTRHIRMRHREEISDSPPVST